MISSAASNDDEGQLHFAIGASVFATFAPLISASDREEVIDEMLRYVSQLADLSASSNRHLLADVLEVMAAKIDDCAVLRDPSTIATLARVVASHDDDVLVMGYARLIASLLTSTLWERCRAELSTGIEALWSRVRARKDRSLFDAIEAISCMFATRPEGDSPDELSELRDDVTSILRNKLGAGERGAALRLAAHLVTCFGFRRRGDNAHAIVVRLACIEISMAFGGEESFESRQKMADRLDAVVRSSSVVTPCLEIVEACCSQLGKLDHRDDEGGNDAESDDVFTFEQVKMMRGAIDDVVTILQQILG